MESLKKNVADFGTKIRDGAQKFAADHEQEINSAKAKAGEWKAKAAGALKKGNRQAKPEDEGDSAAAEAAADSAGREQEPSANTTTSTTSTTTTGASGRWKPGFAAVDKEAIADALRRAKAKVKVFGRTPASTEPETADAAAAATTTAATAAADTSDSAGGNGSIGTEGGETGVAEAPVQA